jgi:ABC-type multidrug transport system fused ATPase/permease subunit
MHRLNPVRTVGEINNIMCKDTAELREFVVFAHNLWSCPLLLIACVALLLHQLGLAGLVSCVLLPLLLPIEAAIGKKSRTVRKEALEKADARMGSVYELIDGIKTVKFTGWGLETHIDALRHQPIPDQGLLIDGHWAAAASGQTMPAVSPIDGQTLCSIAAAGAQDVDRAVQAARRTFEQGVWSRMVPTERKKILHRIADRIETHHTELAVLGVRDNGTEIAMAWKASWRGSFNRIII